MAHEVKFLDGICFYPKSPALELGLTAATFLLFTQLVINVAGGCMCCAKGSTSNSAKSVAILALILSWITFFNGFMLLLAGATLNSEHQADYHRADGECFIVKPGIFAGGALLTLTTAAVGIIYYLAISTVKNESSVSEPGIFVREAHGSQNSHPIFVTRDQQAFSQYSEYPQSSQINTSATEGSCMR
ncbi:hypothetical protein O6H91_01G128000 [Diphasiastrum complanatum]|uniref:Uncharacterized protein n=1 Tax=Diphasiastrum complanatum TaxID=34168 RepID=A0ACC2EVS9_DIPCM|nr:hypothetical protein O6H91_01G128000 [Diphasiastrum complanatum]